MKLNGCHNRQPYRSTIPMQDGWYMDGHSRSPKMLSVPFRMNPECVYTTSELGQADAKCSGCKWKKPPESVVSK